MGFIILLLIFVLGGTFLSSVFEGLGKGVSIMGKLIGIVLGVLIALYFVIAVLF